MAFVMAMTVTFTSCNGDKLKKAEQQNQELTDSLKAAEAAEAELAALIADIDGDMTKIMEVEGIVTTTNVGESNTSRDKIKTDMEHVAQLLKERRQRIAELEAKLKKNGQYSAKNKKALSEAKSKIEEQAQQILALQEELRNANIKIEDLTVKVSDLNTAVDSVTVAKNEAEEEAVKLANELNTCYYVIGSNKELKNQKIISKKFLGKTKVMEGEYEMSYFTKADKRTLTELPLYSKKVKMWTSQPADSYELKENEDGTKTLVITNATKFWEKTNFLVIQIN